MWKMILEQGAVNGHNMERMLRGILELRSDTWTEHEDEVERKF